MEDKKTENRGRRTYLTVIYRDNDTLDFVGVYANPHHVENALGINNANIGKFIKGEINSLSGHIALNVDLSGNAITEENVKRLTFDKAKERQLRLRILKLSEKDLAKLSTDQIRRIQAILSETVKYNKTTQLS